MRLRSRRRPADPGLVALRSVCHELRPPMATLSSLVRALEEQPCPERRSQLARLAVEHAAHAQAVLRQAAAVAAGRTERERAVPLAAVLPSVVSTVPAGRLCVRASPAAARWLVHPHHTRQILINLVGNAARHSAGPVSLRARLRGRRLRLIVADGGGPTPQLLAALHRRTPPPDDHGLGLWVVRELTAARGGVLRARPRTPTGLIMEVVLPRYRN